ncbi:MULTISPECIES: hypothetical protein [Paenibacillus]|uniref:hypothetical protein n=1 Tax=Paenibacillus TaxID=44249 RepID=UPI0022B92F9B|nr:hypothetical protein [Paenibacillus caseinilyticus]MCZ8521577.1 hypothetical protein [Paenibacillus caseinilyticus]
MMKKWLFASLAAALTAGITGSAPAGSAQAASAAPAVSTAPGTFTPPAPDDMKPQDSENLDQTITYSRFGAASFRYRGGGDLRIHIKNNYTCYYKVKYPNGLGYLIGSKASGTVLGSGEEDAFVLNPEDVHGSSSYGYYIITITNDTGASGSVYVSAATLE